MNYDKMLERAQKNLPEAVFEKQRFEIPKVVGHIEGNKTIISNFLKLAGILHRPVDHMLKFILKELATPGIIKGSLFIIGAKIPASRINEKIREYAEEFVLCSECGKPDTKIIKEGDISVLRCLACGAKRNVKSKI